MRIHHLCLVLVVLASRSAAAQYVPVDFTQQTFSAMNIATNHRLAMQMIEQSSRKPGKPSPARNSTITTGNARVARQLAAGYPAAQRATEQLFAQLLDVHAKLEGQLGLSHGDMAGALAVFVVAAYEAYNDVSVDAALYQPIIDSLRSSIASSDAFAKASAGERRTMYEQMATLGVFMIGVRAGLATKPDAVMTQRLRDAAKGYLGKFAIDADKLRLGRDGVSFGG